MNRLIVMIPLGIFLALGIIFATVMDRDPSYIPSPLLQRPMPEFSLMSLDEPPRPVTDAMLAGRPTLINVWGSWCANCGVEHQFLMQLARSGTIDIIGLNWNDERDAARDWLRRLGDPYAFTAFDDEGRVAIDLGVYGAPETFLVDGNGTIVHKHIGPLSQAVWQADFEPRLAQLGVSNVGD